MVPRLQLPGFQFLDRLAFGVRILALQFGRLLREVVFEHLQRHRLSMFVALLAVVCLWSYYNTIVPAFIAKHSFLNKTVFLWDIFGLLSSLVVLG